MEQLNNLDVVFLVIVFVSALVAIVRGATKELLSVIGWVLAAVAVYYLLPVVNPITQKYIASEVLAGLVSGMVILVLFCIFWVLASDKISTQIRFSKLSALDRILGFIFGIARGVIIVILLQILISSLIPTESKEGIFAESKYFKLAGEASGPIKNLIPDEWFDGLKEKTESLGLSGSKDEEKAKDEKSGDETEDKSGDEEGKIKIEISQDALQKTGEELFNKLVQPQPAADGEKGEGAADGYEQKATSELDRLMDAVDEKVVSVSDDAEKAKDAVIDKADTAKKEIKELKENVADSVSK